MNDFVYIRRYENWQAGLSTGQLKELYTLRRESKRKISNREVVQFGAIDAP